MSLRKLMALFAAFAFALCLAGTKPAVAATECDTEDLTGNAITNACDGTILTITEGTFRACVQEVEDGNGGLHQHITFVVNAKAEGSDGNDYVVNATEKIDLNLNSGGSGNETHTLHLNFIGQGKAPNFRCKATAHITRNANGTITADFEKVSEDCECL